MDFLFLFLLLLSRCKYNPSIQQVIRLAAEESGRKLGLFDDSDVARVVYYTVKCHFTFVTRPWPFCGVLYCVLLPGWVNIAFSPDTREYAGCVSGIPSLTPPAFTFEYF